ncbi:MAG: hypothetical protein WAV20_02815, partial [Blastocatellia bacterium]
FACRKPDTSGIIGWWAFINSLTILLILVTYFLSTTLIGLSRFRAEELAFVPLLIVSAIDIAAMTTQVDLFKRWFDRINPNK